MMTTLATQLPTGLWQVDPVHSTAGFAVKHMVVSTFRGRFEDFDARLESVDGGDVRLTGRVRADSIVVKDENLAAHLTAPDFFDTQRYPEILFESTSVSRDGDALIVEGELTIKGQTRRIRGEGTIVDAHEDPYGNQRIGLSLETAVDRTEFGLNWNAPLPRGGVALANNVKLQLELELVQA